VNGGRDLNLTINTILYIIYVYLLLAHLVSGNTGKNEENAKYSQNVFSASTIMTNTQIQTMYRVGSHKANGARYDVKWVDDAGVLANLAHSEFFSAYSDDFKSPQG